MDATLRAIISELFAVSLEVDKLRAQNGELQAAFTDLKAEKEAHKCPGSKAG